MSQTNSQQSNTELSDYDVIIVGGGLVGSIAAIALARLQLSVALIEAKPLLRQPIKNSQVQSSSFDQRSVALSASSVAILQSLGLWQDLEGIANPIEQILVSEQQGFGFTRLNAKDFEQAALGQVIPLTSTGPILYQAVKQENNITCYSPAWVEEVITNSSGCRVAISQEGEKTSQMLSAKLVIGADGSQSKIAQQLNITTSQTSYKQSAIIANIETESEHHNRAYERFTQHGPLALLPLKNLKANQPKTQPAFVVSSNAKYKHNQLSLVWCHQSEQAAKLLQLDDSAFCQSLQQAFSYRLGKILGVSERTVYPLSLHQAEQTFSQNVLLLGNAARTLHPIAGQGFNLGLRDIAQLVELLQQQLEVESKNELDIGTLLQSFKHQCQRDWQQTTYATDGLIRLFSNDFFGLKWSRNKAMSLLNKLPYFKNQLGTAAMGYSGRSSRLARGFELCGAEQNRTRSSSQAIVDKVK
jgi:2-octaprenyl-6-methoxyphenol hydroxylase